MFKPNNASGEIAAGGVAQSFATARKTRRGFCIRNPPSETESLWWSDTGPATMDHNSFELRPGEYYEAPKHMIPTTEISVIAATTGHKFYGRDA